jgi:hypothetical protein
VHHHINDINGKFATGINDTGGKIAAGIKDFKKVSSKTD